MASNQRDFKLKKRKKENFEENEIFIGKFFCLEF